MRVGVHNDINIECTVSGAAEEYSGHIARKGARTSPRARQVICPILWEYTGDYVT